MNISSVLNVFQKNSCQSQESNCPAYSGKLWINYTDKINSLEPTSVSFINTAAKIVAYLVTVPFVVVATPLALVADAVKFSFYITSSALDKLKSKFVKEEEAESNIQLQTKIAVGSVGAAAIAASLYALRSFGLV